MDDLAYLVTACTEIHKITLGTVDPSDQELERVFALACNALKRLSQDSGFIADVTEAFRRRREHEADFNEITTLRHFVEGFSVIETAVLKQAGLPEETISSLLKEATALIEYTREPAPTPEELNTQIAAVRDATCHVATMLARSRKSVEDRKRLKARLARAGYALGGAVMVGANVTAWAASLGLSTAGSAVSGAAGTSLITYGLTPAE
jgi:hypothetical protein